MDNISIFGNYLEPISKFFERKFNISKSTAQVITAICIIVLGLLAYSFYKYYSTKRKYKKPEVISPTENPIPAEKVDFSKKLPDDIIQQILLNESIRFQSNFAGVNKQLKSQVEKVRLLEKKKCNKFVDEIIDMLPSELTHEERAKAVDEINKSAILSTEEEHSDENRITLVKRKVFKLLAQSNFYKSREITHLAVKVDGAHLQHALEAFKTDREIVLEAVRENGFALKFASAALKADIAVVLESVKKHGGAFRFASEDLRANKEVALEAVKSFGFALAYASEVLRADKEFVLEAIKKPWGGSLRFASDSLRADKEVVLKAIRHDDVNLGALIYACNTLKTDNELFIETIKQTKKYYLLIRAQNIANVLKFVSPVLKEDIDFISELLKTGCSVEYASDSLKSNEKFILDSVNSVNDILNAENNMIRRATKQLELNNSFH